MKRRWYRILSVLLTVTMVAGLFPAEVSAQEPETEIAEAVSENDTEEPDADTVSENEDAVSENDTEETDTEESDALVSGTGEETPDEQETEDAEAPEDFDDEEGIDYGTDEEDEETVFDTESYDETIEVSSWEELSAAFKKSTPRKTLCIKLMSDLYTDGSDALTHRLYNIQSYDVYGYVTLDFNGHILSAKLDQPNDRQLTTWTFLRVNMIIGTG